MLRRTAIVALTVAMLAALALVNVRTYLPGDLDTVRAQLRFLGAALREGEGERMQGLFPEGYVFTWALYGLSSAQVARQLGPTDPARGELLDETRQALDRVRSDAARSTFPATLEPPFGAFYASWSLYLFAEYVRAVGPANVSPELLIAFERECARFAQAVTESPTPFLPSYPYLAWPGDTAVGIAALGIHDDVLAPAYRAVIARWLADASTLGDPSLGALRHEAGLETGARGSSLALMSRVLVDADPEFSRRQYELLRRHFVDHRLGAPGVREYARGVDGVGDVDSGPILLGFSGPAVVVGAAAARVHGDEHVARVLLAAVEVVGFPIQLGGRRRYAGGFLPVGDAFIAWARSAPTPGEEPWGRAFPMWWRLPIHLVSALIAALLLWRARAVLRTVA